MIFCRFFAVLSMALLSAPLLAQMPPPGQGQVWPMPGTDADVRIVPNSAQNRMGAGDENIRIVSSIGGDLSIENNINVRSFDPTSFSGGANLTHPHPAPPGFNPFENQAELPFMHSQMLENDGAAVLSMSRTNRRPAPDPRRFGDMSGQHGREFRDMMVDTHPDEPALELKDQVRSWVVASGQTLREVLQAWCDREGWDLIWNTPREYPIAASAVFKGRFMDVSAALVRNFSRATPVPHAKFYKGNRVLVISTRGDD